MNLITDDKEYDNVMSEIISYKFGAHIRVTFATLLLYATPTNPGELWEKHKDKIVEDLLRWNSSLSKEDAYNLALYDINKMLGEKDKTLADYPSMPEFMLRNDLPYSYIDGNYNPVDELAEANHVYSQMYDEQKIVYDHVKKLIDNAKSTDQHSRCVFIEGQAGSGKSYVLKAIDHYARSKVMKITNMASVGVAAMNLREGRTVFNRFTFPVPLENRNSPIQPTHKDWRELQETDIFIWDEAPCSAKEVIHSVDRKLREIMRNNKPMGGKIIIFAGDFRQTLPIQENANIEETISLSIKYSDIWKDCKKFKLTINKRVQPEEEYFAQQLIRIGNGDDNDENGEIQLPDNCPITYKESLHDEIFKESISNKNF